MASIVLFMETTSVLSCSWILSSFESEETVAVSGGQVLTALMSSPILLGFFILIMNCSSGSSESYSTEVLCGTV